MDFAPCTFSLANSALYPYTDISLTCEYGDSLSPVEPSDPGAGLGTSSTVDKA